MQESNNQIRSAQGAADVQRMTARAKQTRLQGAAMVDQQEIGRTKDLMQLKAGRQQAQRDFRSSLQAQNQAIMGGIGDIVGAGIQGFAAGGGFTKDVGQKLINGKTNPDFIKGGFSFNKLVDPENLYNTQYKKALDENTD